MQPGQVASLIERFPLIKRRWTILLKGEPPLTPLGRSETLGFLMDATLMQLTAALQRGGDIAWLRNTPASVGSVHSYCACGAPPVQRYFASGAIALEETLTPVAPALIGPTLEVLRAIGEHEIGSLCRACPHAGSPACGLIAQGKPA